MDAHGLLSRNAKMWRPWVAARGSTGPIGLDFGTERVNLVQVGRTSGHCIVNAATTVAYDREREGLLENPGALKQLLRHAFSERPFRGRKVVAAVPPSLVEMLVINYRSDDAAGEAAAIVRATEERLGDSVDARVVDYLPIANTQDGGNRAALVAIADHDAIVRFLETLRKCSLDVVALEVGPIAIQRLISEMDSQADATVVAVTFGTARSYVTVLSNGNLLLDRELEFGTNALAEKLGETLDCPATEAHELLQRHGLALGARKDIDDPEAGIKSALTEILKPHFVTLAKDIVRTKDYAQAETRCAIAGPIYAFGSLARWPNADRLLSGLCGIEISSVNPFYGLDVANNAADLRDIGPICSIAVATGLALRAGS